MNIGHYFAIVMTVILLSGVIIGGIVDHTYNSPHSKRMQRLEELEKVQELIRENDQWQGSMESFRLMDSLHVKLHSIDSVTNEELKSIK